MKALPKKKKLVNHIVFLVDCSGSMARRLRSMEKLLGSLIDNEIETATREKIESKFYFYTFGDNLSTWQKGASIEHGMVNRFNLQTQGGTSLIRCTMECIDTIIPMLDSKNDNGVLLRVITDGQETEQRYNGSVLNRKLNGLNDDWTVAILVPDKFCEEQAKAYGFPPDNIEIWDISSDEGMQEMGVKFAASTQSYCDMRSAGQKSTKCLFKLNEVNKTEVKQALEEVNPGDYQTLIVRAYDNKKEIKDFVESWTKEPYRVGSAYYQLTKPEKIQAGKVIAVVDKQTGKMYSGVNARKLLGLPNAEVKVAAADFAKFDVFVQSHSTNRHLVANTHLIVFK